MIGMGGSLRMVRLKKCLGTFEPGDIDDAEGYFSIP